MALWTLSPLIGREAEAVVHPRVEEQPASGDYVVLVHGVQWMRDSLQPVADRFHHEGYHTINLRWPTRRFETLGEAADFVRTSIASHCSDPSRKIHLVGHSMGSIVLRQMLAEQPLAGLGRIVLLAPPNHGTPLARAAKPCWIRKIIGKPVRELRPLGTVTQLPEILPTPPGIIMGSKSGWFPMFSPFIPGEDDGVVPVEGGKLKEMGGFLVMPVSHTSMPKHGPTLDAAVSYVRKGGF